MQRMKDLFFIKKSGMKLFFRESGGRGWKKGRSIKKEAEGGEGTGSNLFFSSGPITRYVNRTSFISVIRYK